MTGTVLLNELSAETYVRLTGEEPPATDQDEDEPATTIYPGEGKTFLLATWKSVDAEWEPVSVRGGRTSIELAVGGNSELMLAEAREGQTEHDGAVLATVDASLGPDAASLRTVLDEGEQQLSLVDGTLLASVAPWMYERSGEVEVSESEEFETEVEDGFASDVMHLRGGVDSAYMTSFIDNTDGFGGHLGWAGDDEVFVVVQLAWKKDYSANIEDVSRIALVLNDGTELLPEQEQSSVFGDHSKNVATFAVPSEEPTATVRISPRFQQILDKEFDESHDPITATLTFA